MSGKTSFGPIITGELTDGAEMQQYSQTHFFLVAAISWRVRSLPVNSWTSTDENVKWRLSV